jgi:hypothetical protein
MASTLTKRFVHGVLGFFGRYYVTATGPLDFGLLFVPLGALLYDGNTMTFDTSKLQCKC